MGNSDTMTGEESKQPRIRRPSAITALTYSGLLDAPCLLLITSSLLPPQLFTLSVHKVMTQDFQSFLHIPSFPVIIFPYALPQLCQSFMYFLLLKKFLATSLTSEVKWGERCQELTLVYCPGRCSFLSFK